jgi:hypothetical protein
MQLRDDRASIRTVRARSGWTLILDAASQTLAGS